MTGHSLMLFQRLVGRFNRSVQKPIERMDSVQAWRGQGRGGKACLSYG
jgi:hypothetical protein